MNHLIEVENLGICFHLERQELALVRDVLLRPFRRRSSGRTFWALRGISFQLEKGRVLGVIGENGAGKSTLLMALAGIYAPDEGRSLIKGRVASLLEIGAGFRSELTGRENAFLYGAILGIPRRRIQGSIEEIVAFSGLEEFIDSPLRTYSTGMRMRLGFTIAMSMEPDVFLVDEALSVGDTLFQKKAIERVEAFRRKGGTLVFVSHNMTSIGNLCDECLLLDHGRQVHFGKPLDVIATYWEQTWGKQVNEKTETAQQQLQNLTKGARRWGSGEVRISRFSMFDDQGKPTQKIEQGAPLHVEMEFQADRDPGELLFQVSLFEKGRTVTILPSDPASYPKGLADQTGKVHLRIDTSTLPLGLYQVDAEIRNEAFTKMYDHLDKFTTLEVIQAEGFQAPPEGIRLPCKWTFSPAERSP